MWAETRIVRFLGMLRLRSISVPGPPQRAWGRSAEPTLQRYAGVDHDSHGILLVSENPPTRSISLRRRAASDRDLSSASGGPGGEPRSERGGTSSSSGSDQDRL